MSDLSLAASTSIIVYNIMIALFVLFSLFWSRYIYFFIYVLSLKCLCRFGFGFYADLALQSVS